MPASSSAFAELDLGRQDRRGYPEAVYCAGKTPEQVRRIAAAVAERPDVVTLFTRADEAHAAAVRAALPDATWDPDARLLAWPPEVPPSTGGLVLVLAAGTSDLPVAKEAWLTARYLGRRAELVVDVGVAGPAPDPRQARPAALRPGGRRRRRAWTARCPASSPAWSGRRSWRCRPRSATGRRSAGSRRC